MKNYATFMGLGLIVAFLCSGCGGQKLPADLPRLYPTTIVILQDGTPLAGAAITLINADPEVTRYSGSSATTDASGRAVMFTEGMYQGLPAGTYKVTVLKLEYTGGASVGLPPGVPEPPCDVADYDGFQNWQGNFGARVEAFRRQQESRAETAVFTLVNPQFADMDRTTLTITVASGTREHRLDVGTAVRERYVERIR